MDKNIWDANLQALSKNNPRIYQYLKVIDRENKKTRYSFCLSETGEKVPAYNPAQENSKLLHSTRDPKTEAKRLVSAILNGNGEDNDTGFIVMLGLGGGFLPQAALEQTQARILVIDFCLEEIADLFYSMDYTGLLQNERFSLLVDPSNKEIKNFILENYKPQLYGGIKTIPLRTRIEFNVSLFKEAANAVQDAVDIISTDYSVQAHFGKRWFSNIIRNLKFSIRPHENQVIKNFIVNADEAAIAAAGPSLNEQLETLYDYKLRKVFVICSDTALPVLLRNNIEPDAVVSIDCQHISYYHFMGMDLRGIPLILDIASPPPLASFSTLPIFFSSGHPLAVYASQKLQNIPPLDTSGGNVTYACLSLAEHIGIKKITLFGCDFSYINSETYARGTYIYPFFEKRQNRFSTMEALFSSFLYRSPFIRSEDELFEKNRTKKNYRETSSLRFYKKKLEEKAAAMNVQITAAKGNGVPLNLPCNVKLSTKTNQIAVTQGKTKISGIDFLERYREDIASLPPVKYSDNYYQILNEESRRIFTTLLPLAAAVKYRNPLLKTNDLIEETKLNSIKEIDRLLKSGY